MRYTLYRRSGAQLGHDGAEAWLAREDAVAHEDRIRRLAWLDANSPSAQSGFIVPGGWLSQRLLEEAKYCFAYGQDIAAAVLGVAFVERVLAARFYGSGRDDLERAQSYRLLVEARDLGWLSSEEYALFDGIRALRNPMAHFRRPLNEDTHERRAIEGGGHPNDVAEEDSQRVLAAVLHLLGRLAA
jgi:hypothetical protein